MAYDPAGNMTYDGTYSYGYDAWNRMITVRNAYRTDDGVLHEGSVVSTSAYDGENRRVSKSVTTGTYLDGVEHYYYDGQKLVETRNGSGQVLKQQVWGIRYIDELVTISINTDYAQNNTCETQYWVAQDANWNVVGVVHSAGTMVERYEYTPYGERKVFFSPGSNDPMLMASTLSTRRVSGIQLCEFGHQGLMHDAESGLIYNRARMLSPTLGRFLQRDPLGYVDGGSLYEYVRSNPSTTRDPSGLWRFYFDEEDDDGQVQLNAEVERWVQSNRLRLRNLLGNMCGGTLTQGCSRSDCFNQSEIIADAIIDAIAEQLREGHGSSLGGWIGNGGHWGTDYNNNCHDWQTAVGSAIHAAQQEFQNGGGCPMCFDAMAVDSAEAGHHWIEINGGGRTIYIDPWPGGGWGTPDRPGGPWSRSNDRDPRLL